MNIYLSRIFDFTFDEFRHDVENSEDKIIDVYLACIGGNVNAGFAIANYIEAVNENGSKTINTHILSNADSIATVIFLAPKPENRTIVQSSQMFKHEPLFMELDGVNAEAAIKAAETLEIQAQRIADYYVKKIEGLTNEEARSLMKGETTLSSEDMIKYKIVSEVKEAFSIAAIKGIINKSDMSLFKNKKPFQTVALKQDENEVSAVFRGDLVVGAEIEAIGGDELKGRFVTNENTVDIEDGKVTNMEPIEVEKEKEGEEEMVDAAVEKAVAPILDMVENLTKVVENLAGQKSNHKPAKRSVNNANTVVDEQKLARKSSKERQEANYKARVEAANAKINKIG